MRKTSVRALLCCLGLLLTAGLALLYPGGRTEQEKAPSTPVLIRLWVPEGESALSAWLRKRAAAYEKETRARVYLRSAAAEETRAALSRQEGFLPPDLALLAGEGETVALRGYALVLRDDAAPAVTASPTFSLFTRPTQAPAPVPTPAPLGEEDLARFTLVPPDCTGALPNAVKSASPLSDFLQGKADAALLTAAQAAQLPFGFRAYALPEGRGMAAFGAQALSANGEAFLRFLLSPASQQALRDQGLYSPRFPLCQGQDSLDALIESGWIFPK